jgi:hypothetical protein
MSEKLEENENVRTAEAVRQQDDDIDLEHVPDSETSLPDVEKGHVEAFESESAINDSGEFINDEERVNPILYEINVD